MHTFTRRSAVFALAALMAAAAAPAPVWAGGKHHKKRMLVTFREGTSRAEREQAAKDMGLKLSDDFDSIQVSVLEAAGDVAPQEMTKARRHASVVTVEEDVYRNWLLESPASFQSTPFPGVEAVLQTLGKPRREPAPDPTPSPADPSLGGGTPARPRAPACRGAWRA